MSDALSALMTDAVVALAFLNLAESSSDKIQAEHALRDARRAHDVMRKKHYSNLSPYETILLRTQLDILKVRLTRLEAELKLRAEVA